MRKSILLSQTLLLTCMLHAQEPYMHGQFVIQGEVKGYTETTFDFGLSSFFGGATNSVVVEEDGNFRQSFPVQHLQNIHLLLNGEAIRFTVNDGDTLKLTWDNNNFENTFHIAGINNFRTKELAVEKALYWNVGRSKYLMYDSLSKLNARPDPKVMCHLLNAFFNREVQLILDSAAGSITPALNYLLMDIYFDYARTMKNIDIRSIEPARPVLQLDKTKTYPPFWLADTIYTALHRVLREDWWLNVPSYRNYLFDYVRFGQPKGGGLFDSFATVTPAVTQDKDDFGKVEAALPKQGKIPELFAWREIRRGDQYIGIQSVQEWYNTKVVIDGFRMYSFEDTEKGYLSLIDRLESAYLRDTLQKIYKSIKRLRPGNPAPQFSLQDEKGNKVSLADFKGKVVYIDFWGIGCGPCIDQIKKYVPDLHKRYEGKDVVFLNICVDAKGKKWMDALQKYEMGGVNLYADGWDENSVCQDYSVKAVPHYVLIDKDGNIVNNNAPRASEMLVTGRDNAIDALLKQKGIRNSNDMKTYR